MCFGSSIARKSREPLAFCIAAVLSSGTVNTVHAGEGAPVPAQTAALHAPDFLGAPRTFAPTLPKARQAHAPAAPSSMAVAVVTSCADDGGFDTLRHAVLAANPTDTIDLSGLSCSKLTLQAGAIDVAVSDLTILGPGRGALTIDGNQTDRVFKHDGAGTLTLSNLTVANGKHAADKAYGGCIYAKGKVVLNGVIVTSCTALGQTSAIGGAIFAKDDLDLESSTLADNRAEAQVGVAGDLGAVAGAAVSVTHGVQELLHPEPATDFLVGYVVLAVSFLLEGISFLRSVRQARPAAELFERDLIEQVMATSDPTLRAVFAEDAAALLGLLIAAVGLGAHELTGSSVPDAVGSILVGLLLAVVASYLIERNRAFLLGEEADPRIRSAVILALLQEPEVARVTYLRLEFVGPRIVSVIGDVDLTGDDTESHVAVRLRALEAKIAASPVVAGAVLSLSAPDEPSLAP